MCVYGLGEIMNMKCNFLLEYKVNELFVSCNDVRFSVCVVRFGGGGMCCI